MIEWKKEKIITNKEITAQVTGAAGEVSVGPTVVAGETGGACKAATWKTRTKIREIIATNPGKINSEMLVR